LLFKAHDLMIFQPLLAAPSTRFSSTLPHSYHNLLFSKKRVKVRFTKVWTHTFTI